MNQQKEKSAAIGATIVSGGSGDFSVAMNGNNNNNNGNLSNDQQQLVSKVAEHCGCPINIATQALIASNWDPANAVTRIETMKRQNGQ